MTSLSAPTTLQVIPALNTGGAERGCVDIAAAVVKLGGRAIVMSAGGALVDELERAGAMHIVADMGRKSPVAIVRNGGRIAQVIRDHDVDLVHARSRAPAWSAIIAARRTGRPFVTTVHGAYRARNAAKRAYNSVMARGRRVIAISDFIADYVRTSFPWAAERIRVVPRGIDLTAFRPDEVTPDRIDRLRDDWNLPATVPIILLPGRLTRLKGQAVAVRALARMRDTNAHLVLVGADRGTSDYADLVSRHVMDAGLADRVHMTAQCHDMPAAYALADVVVSTSTEPEGFGRTVVEAMAMGRPMVCTDLGAPPTLLSADAGRVVPASDPAALAAVLDDLTAIGGDARASMAAAGRDRARLFDVATMAQSTLATYAEALDDHRTSGT